MTQPTATAPHEQAESISDRQVSHTEDAVESVTEQLDRISLEQALIDVEVANARAIDLTARLTEAHAEIARLRQQTHHAAVAVTTSRPLFGSVSSARSLVVGPIKAVARRVLPLEVRIRIRRMLG